MINNKPDLPGLGDGSEFGFFFTAPGSHHLYYLLPYIRATKHCSVMVFAPTDDYLVLLRETFPDVNFISCLPDTQNEAIALFARYSVILFANGDPWFVNGVQPYLPQETLLVRVLHGASSKFTDDPGYFAANVYAWDALIVQGSKDVDTFYELNKLAPELRAQGDIIDLDLGEKGTFRLVQSGNLRVRHFLEDKPAQQNLKNSDKKTILVMSTHPTNPGEQKNNYSEIRFFLELFDAMQGAERYNFLFNLHPNLVDDHDLLQSLKEICVRKGVPLDYELFTADYFPMMDAADALICDRTSAVFDFFHFDKPVIFLDSTEQCPEHIAEEDILSSFWSYRNGAMVAPSNRDQFEDILALQLDQDSFKEVRDKCLEYVVANKDYGAETVLSLLLSHPKLVPSNMPQYERPSP
ncbi:MAG: hypothetical protein HOJ67_16950 [Rhodospirillaceae bacterium]|nr:hypothetical protein [Rhodospirillaceae bacterium]